jgi:hypothetical protein
LDIFGHVGERPQALPQRYGPAGEQRGKRAADQEDRQDLPDGYRLHYGHDVPMTTKMTPTTPMIVSTVDQGLSAL